MTVQVGTRNRVGFSTAEVTFGTSPGVTGAKSWPFEGERPKVIPITIDDNGKLIGVYEKGRQSVVAGYRTEWSGTFAFGFDCLAYWLFRALGTLNTSGMGPYDHVITNKQGQLDTFTMFWQDANTTATKLEEFTGMVCKSLEIGGRAGGDMYIRPTLIGRGSHPETILAMPGQSTEAINPFNNITVVNLGGTITWATGAVAGGTSYVDQLEEWSLTITNDLVENRYGANSLYPKSFPRTGVNFATKGLIDWEENALAGNLAAVEAQTTKTMLIKAVNGTSSAILGLSKVFFKDPGVGGMRDVLKWAFDGEGKYDETAALAAKFFVTNGTASYT